MSDIHEYSGGKSPNYWLVRLGTDLAGNKGCLKWLLHFKGLDIFYCTYNSLSYNVMVFYTSKSLANYCCFLRILLDCPTLTNPSNSMVDCSLKGGVFANPGDTCSFTCNNGYELTGNAYRICQTDGSWSGIDAVCEISE